MKRIFIFLFFAIFFSSLLATLAIAQVGVPPQPEGCYCRAPCQSMIPPELMDCRILTAPEPTHPYYCPGLCKTTTTTTTTTEQIVCPQDAKRCPDGSYVGRVPPTCEFAPCPTSCSQVGGQCFPIGFPDQCPVGYTPIKNASCGPSFQMVCCKITTTETTTTTTKTIPPQPIVGVPGQPKFCIQPLGRPTIVPPERDCPPIEWIPPARIALFGFAILQDFSDFKTVELGVTYPLGTAPATGWLWVDNVKYALKNIVLDKPLKKLTADVYNNTDLIGTISLTFSQKAYPRPEQPRVVNYRDVAFGEMKFNNVDYKVFLIGRLFTIPVPLAAVPLR